MARTRSASEEARQALLDSAERFVSVTADGVVIVTRGAVEVIRRAAGPAPEDVNAYDAAILAALTDSPQSSRRLARSRPHLQFLPPRTVEPTR